MVEVGTLRKAVYDFPTEDDQELALNVGDIVQVLHWVDKQWCCGMCNGREGNFPSGFTIDVKIPKLEENQELFAPISKFEAQELGDLPFEKGDLIVGIRPVDQNWWEGECNGNRGIFPITHVWKIDKSRLTKTCTPQKVYKKARVKMNLKAQIKDKEMDLFKGDIVLITEEIEKGWYRGECNGKTGIFPSSVVTFISSDNENDVIPSSSSDSEIQNSTMSCSVNSTNDQYGYDSINSGITAYGRTVYPFRGEFPNELTFAEGEIVNLIRHVDEKWLEGEIDGKVGIFPKDFIDIIVDCPGNTSSELGGSMFPPDTYGRVLSEFHLLGEAEAKLSEGDTVTLVRKINDDFYEVLTDSARTCICPVSIIEFIGNGPNLLPPSYSEVVEADSNYSFDKQSGDIIAFGGAARPLSYPSTSFDRSFTALRGNDFKSSHSINDKIAENLSCLDTSLSSKTSSSPSLARRSYSLSSGNSSPLNFSDVAWEMRTSTPPACTVNANDSLIDSVAYENVGSEHSNSWSSAQEVVSPSAKMQPTVNTEAQLKKFSMPKMEKEGKNAQGEGLMTNGVQQEASSLPVGSGDINNRGAEDSAQREIVATKKREAEEKRRSEERMKKMREQRDCVVCELIQTERDYKSQLQILHDIFMSDSEQAKAKGIDIGTLFGNLDEVIDVAGRLLRRLEKNASASCESQMIGQCFVDMSDDMKEVYGHYCRNHDDVSAVLDKYDEKSPAGQYLKHKVELMKRQTNCFDLPSMLIKPVQRILKYPLLLNELVKCTEDNHPDKQSLIKAIGLMTDVATSINEFKRRKDLVFKYRKHADTSLSGRISKLNIHSVLKKSSRFGMRISNSIGLTHVTKDENFAKVEHQFHTLEKSIRIFVKDVNGYIEKTEELVKTAFRMAEDIAELYQEKKTQQEVDQFRSVHRIIATQFWETNKQILERNVLFILKQLLQTFHGPSNLIQKRYDKLLDYDACSNKLEKNKDITKVKMLQDNLQIAKNNYEALNTQLLDDLPKLYSTSVEILYDCVCCFLKAKRNFVGKSAREMLGLMELPLLLGAQGGILDTFQVKHNLVTDNLSLMTIVPKQLFPSCSASSLKRNSSPGIARLSFGAGSHSNTQLKQSPSDQAFLKSTYPVDQLYTACQNYDAVDLLDINLAKGDVVGVVKQQDPMGNKLRWFVDKGGSKGFVAAKVLKKFEVGAFSQIPTKTQHLSFGKGSIEGPKPPYSYSTLPKNFHANRQSDLSLNQRGVNSTQNRQPVRPAPPVTSTSQSSTLPVLSPALAQVNKLSDGGFSQNVPNSSKQTDSIGMPLHRYEEIDDLLGHYDTISHESPNSGAASLSAATGMSVADFDPYGPSKQQTQLYDNVPQSGGASDSCSGHRYEIIPEDTATRQTLGETSEYYYAIFDFIPRGVNQLKVVKGQVVLVLHKCDLNQNSEWWFVEDRHGNKGYVPSNYLNSYPICA